MQKEYQKSGREMTVVDVFLIDQQFEVCLLNEFFYIEQESTVAEYYDKLMRLLSWVMFHYEELSEIGIKDVFIKGLKEELREK